MVIIGKDCFVVPLVCAVGLPKAWGGTPRKDGNTDKGMVIIGKDFSVPPQADLAMAVVLM